jgi:hypothetical protein
MLLGLLALREDGVQSFSCAPETGVSVAEFISGGKLLPMLSMARGGRSAVGCRCSPSFSFLKRFVRKIYWTNAQFVLIFNPQFLESFYMSGITSSFFIERRQLQTKSPRWSRQCPSNNFGKLQIQKISGSKVQ